MPRRVRRKVIEVGAGLAIAAGGATLGVQGLNGVAEKSRATDSIIHATLEGARDAVGATQRFIDSGTTTNKAVANTSRIAAMKRLETAARQTDRSAKTYSPWNPSLLFGAGLFAGGVFAAAGITIEDRRRLEALTCGVAGLAFGGLLTAGVGTASAALADTATIDASRAINALDEKPPNLADAADAIASSQNFVNWSDKTANTATALSLIAGLSLGLAGAALARGPVDVMSLGRDSLTRKPTNPSLDL